MIRVDKWMQTTKDYITIQKKSITEKKKKKKKKKKTTKNPKTKAGTRLEQIRFLNCKNDLRGLADYIFISFGITGHIVVSLKMELLI